MPTVGQALQGSLVGSPAVALVASRAIPLKAVALQCSEDFLARAGHGTWWVDILNPQQPLAPIFERLQQARNGGEQRSEVQWAGRGRCEPPDVGGDVLAISGSDRPCLGTDVPRAPVVPEPRGTAWQQDEPQDA